MDLIYRRKKVHTIILLTYVLLCILRLLHCARTINYNLIQIFTMWARTIRFAFCHLISLIARVNWRFGSFSLFEYLLFKFQRFTCAIGHISIVSCFIWCRRFVVAVSFFLVRRSIFVGYFQSLSFILNVFKSVGTYECVSSQVHVYFIFFIYSDALTHGKTEILTQILENKYSTEQNKTN